MPFSARSVKDLLFLFPPSATEHRNTQRTIQSIPKTIIFFRSTDQLLNARFQLVKTLASRYSIPAKAAKRIVQAFYSHRSEFSKREIHAWFLDDNSEVRILAATDAVGMGMDFPNVEVCIQFDVPDNIDILLQRLGRAGRNPKLKAYFVWFIPSKLLKESSDVQSTTTTEQPTLPTPNQRKKELPLELLEIIKTEGRKCFRQALWAPFAAGGYEYTPQADRCCYFCHDNDRQHVYTHADEPTSAKEGQRRQWKEKPHAFPPPVVQTPMTIMLRKALVEWATITSQNFLCQIPGASNDCYELILPKPIICKISAVGNYIETVVLLQAVVPEWTWCHMFGQDVVGVTKRGRDSTFVARDFMNAGLKTLEINVQHFNDDLSRAAMTPSGLVVADTTVLDPGQEELQLDEEQDENNADDHSYRAQLLSDHEETASEGSQIGDDDDVDLE